MKDYQKSLIEECGYEVHLANDGKLPKPIPWPKEEKKRHSVDWVAHLILPKEQGKDHVALVPPYFAQMEALFQWALTTHRVDELDRFMDEAVETMAGEIPDSTTLQAAYETGLDSEKGPCSMVSRVDKLVSVHFPTDRYKGETAPLKYRGRLHRIPVRVIAALWCASLACEEANRGDAWHLKQSEVKTEPTMAGCRMSHSCYVLRRHSKATLKQIRKMLN